MVRCRLQMGTYLVSFRQRRQDRVGGKPVPQKSFEKSVDEALLQLRAGSLDYLFQNAPIERLNQRTSCFNNHNDL